MSDKKYIRFINSDYKTLFHLPDGGRIRITYPDGKQIDRTCRFCDEFHTKVGNNLYHICEFAEHMEKNGASYEPLDYIRELDFYAKRFFLADGTARGPAYYVIDGTESHGLAYAPKGAPKGRKYCVFEKLPDGYKGYRIGDVVQWSGTQKALHPKSWGFNPDKIKAITQRPKVRTEPER